ncbi:MAG: hypothetical protein ACJ75G_07665 [Gaiellaceae bacterium]
MSWQPVNLAAPEFAEPTEPPVVLGLFYTGKRHALSGPPEAAKTLVGLTAGLEWQRAGLGRFALVDFEQGAPATRLLLEELGATPSEIADVYYVEPDGPPNEDDVAALVEAGVTFVILDAAAGAYGSSGLDDNKRADAERFARLWIAPLWQRGIATVLLDHVVKNSEQRGKFAIGSERKLGQVDVHLGLEAVTHISRGGHGLIRVTVHKDRPAHLRRPHPCEIHLASDPETHAISWEMREPTATSTSTASANGWQRTALMEKVSRYIAHQGEPVSRNTIEKAGLGKQATYVRRAIDALIDGGYITEQAGPRGARLYTNTQPFTSSDFVSLRPDEDGVTSSDLVRPLQGDEVADEDEVERIHLDEVDRLLSKHGDLA